MSGDVPPGQVVTLCVRLAAEGANLAHEVGLYLHFIFTNRQSSGTVLGKEGIAGLCLPVSVGPTQ